MSRFVLTTFIVAAVAVSAAAQKAAPPRFFIERIDVRQVQRISPELVKSESLLREGAEYSEDELRSAASRLSRLPFLLSADFALERGSEHGRHVLVITVMETKPFFFYIDARPTLWDESRRTLDYETDPGTESKDAAVGVRSFIGGRGILHAGVSARRSRQSFTTAYSAVAVGYTRYDLFGTRAFATINMRLPIDSPAEGGISPQLVVGMPLTASQTLTFNYEDTLFRRDTVDVFGVEIDRQDAERLMSLTWTYNTTNKPFVPTRGTIVRVAPLYSMRDRAAYGLHIVVPGPTPSPNAYAQHINGFGLDVAALRYWELSERNSVSAGILAGWAEVEDRLHPTTLRERVLWRPAYQIVSGGYSRSLWRDDSKTGDSRIEFDGRIVRRQRNVQEGKALFGVTPDEENTLQTSASWVRRSSWGMLRLGFGYSWGR